MLAYYLSQIGIILADAEIIRLAEMDAGNVASLLTVLEVKRLVVQKPGKLYLRSDAFQR